MLPDFIQFEAFNNEDEFTFAIRNNIMLIECAKYGFLGPVSENSMRLLNEYLTQYFKEKENKNESNQ